MLLLFIIFIFFGFCVGIDCCFINEGKLVFSEFIGEELFFFDGFIVFVLIFFVLKLDVFLGDVFIWERMLGLIILEGECILKVGVEFINGGLGGFIGFVGENLGVCFINFV